MKEINPIFFTHPEVMKINNLYFEVYGRYVIEVIFTILPDKTMIIKDV